MTKSKPTFMDEQIAREIERNKPIQAYANHAMYTDVQPYEVIEKRTENKVIIRKMKAEKRADWKPEIIAGGFSGVCIDSHDQGKAWDITADEEGETFAIRWSKANRRWQDADGSRFFMSEQPVKFYDYNF